MAEEKILTRSFQYFVKFHSSASKIKSAPVAKYKFLWPQFSGMFGKVSWNNLDSFLDNGSSTRKLWQKSSAIRHESILCGIASKVGLSF
jgi:hypothetical protein